MSTISNSTSLRSLFRELDKTDASSMGLMDKLSHPTICSTRVRTHRSAFGELAPHFTNESLNERLSDPLDL